MAKSKVAYHCTECGGQSTKWQGQCPHCFAWNTLTESIIEGKSVNRYASIAQTSTLQKLSDVETQNIIRQTTGISEFDRVLGGGLVGGAVIPIPMGHIWDSFLRVFLGLVIGIILGVPLGLFMGLNRFAKGFFDPLIELYRPVPPLAWAPLIISVLGIDNVGKVFLLFMVSFSIMIISARAGASGTQLSKIHASHSLGASNWQILRYVIFPNSLPEILTGVRVAVGMCWGTLVAAEFLAGTTGIGFVENVAKKYFQYEVIWITIFVMGMLGLLFDITLRKIINKTIPWQGKG